MHVNLLPQDFVLRLLIWRRLRQWSVVWLIASVAAGSINHARYRVVLVERSELAALESRCAPLRKVQRLELALEDQLAMVEAERTGMRSLEPDEQPLALLSFLANALQATEQKLQIERLQFSHRPQVYVRPVSVAAGTAPSVPAVPPVAATSQPAIQVTLQGLASDDDAIAALVTALRGRGVFRQVELANSTEFAAPHGLGRKFEIVCTAE